MPERRLIINVDDIGIHEGAVDAAVQTITHGVAASGSVMTVCGGTRAALELLADCPEVPVGVHLTLTRDQPDWRWAPLTAGRSIQLDGLLFPIDQRDRLLAQAALADVEAEFRAQIEVLLAAGRRPTHLDWHCLADGGREDVFDLTLDLAAEYRTQVRAWTDRGRQLAGHRGHPVQDHPFLDSFTLPVEGKERLLVQRVRDLPEGLTEWAVHPASRTPGDASADVRDSDRAALLSARLRAVLDEEGIAVRGHGTG